MATIQKAEGYSVVFTTLKEEKDAVLPEKQKDLLMKLFRTFGCFSMFLEEKNIEELKSIRVDGGAIQPEPGLYVVVIQDFVTDLTNTELQAVVLHELGHITNGHFNKIKSGEAVVIDNVLEDVNLELEADEFAAKYVGKAAMKSAVVKVIHNTVNLAQRMAEVGNKPFHRDVYLHEIFNTEGIKTRLNALN